MSDDTPTKSEERYVSFRGIDCTGNVARVLEHVFAIIDEPANSNPFWDRFKERIAAAAHIETRVNDELCLLCSHTYYIEELFETHGDEAGLGRLKRLEEECC
ncbi:N(2)-fixation sustaining protein CowN [Telmatospirillum sp.]|uniref:N(2)-fixation sustaining protein CowN n=1 Tax=Telmatospirillum sp. TaxID=2079197 RepID=UPI002848017E|nr:N(2)-fixation sustaining protein CowN [Telmatospirillum sp.]MDR3441341.1 N(2)-fixation sustaining protein CowN [Telmatospirillum sp.]